MNNTFNIKITWTFVAYLLFLVSVMYFVCKAIINTYDPALAGLVFVMFIFSYGWSIFLIRKEE